MSTHEIEHTATSEADVMFSDSLDMARGCARRKLEVYQEARQLRRTIGWLDEEPAPLPQTPQRLRTIPRHAWEMDREF